ncbi:hypothetical protein [Nostoc sp.]|uniref:hypothetical protein n=1 Tax=Nostoc sp. TaxID=1180 RepID=UPI002FF90078
MYNEVIANHLKALLTDAIATPLALNFASQILRHLFSFRGIVATVAIVLPDFLMHTRRDQA